MFFYYDLEGVAAKLEQLTNALPGAVKDLMTAAPDIDIDPQVAMTLAHLDWRSLVNKTGLHSIQSLGMSSRQLPSGAFRNVTRLNVSPAGEGIFGLAADVQGLPGLAHAPDSADFVFGMEWAPEKYLAFALSLAREIFGSAGMSIAQGFISQSTPDGALVWQDIIEGAPRRLTVLGRLQPSAPLDIPNLPMSLPGVELAIILEGHRAEVHEWLVKEIMGPRPSQSYAEYEFHRFDELAIPGMDIFVARHDGQGRLIIGTGEAFGRSVVAADQRLADNPLFREALASVAVEGSALLYLSPNFIQAIAGLRNHLYEQLPLARLIVPLYAIQMPMLGVDPVDYASLQIAGSDAEGFFRVSHWPFPLSPVSAVQANQSVIVAGLVAAMAIPAFQKVRENAQEKTIMNNLRMIASAGQQYLLEHGVEEVAYPQLAGEYFSAINPVAGESYEHLRVGLRGGVLEVTTAAGKTISYSY